MKMDTQMNIRTSSEVKKKAMKVYDNLGVDLSTAINVFLRKSIEQKGFPFEVREEKPNKQTIKAMEKAYKDKGTSKTFETAEEMMDWLND